MSMKAFYLLFGLLLLATVSSDPSTPFLVNGWVINSDGSPVNDIEVNLTNINTGEVFTAGISTNHYQLMPVNISAGDVVSFNVTDGVTYNITNHIVTMDDIDRGGIFDFVLILMSTSPGITDFSPESPVYDVENATRTFSITIDQVVNVTWLINGITVQTDMGVTHASYTNTSAIAGIWNVSTIASNENGTTMQMWTWDVAMLPKLNITSFTPASPVYDVENATRTFSITIDQVVDVIWLINGIEVQANKSTTNASYTNTSTVIGTCNVSAIASNENGTVMQPWTWHVSPSISVLPALFVIYGEVFYENNINVDEPYVVVTNLNTSREFVADNHSGEHFYQIITDTSEIHTDDVLLINGSKNGILAGSMNHTVSLNESRSGAIRVDINRGWADLQVTRISKPSDVFDNRTNIINATIANNGTTCAEGFNVSFAVNGDVIDRAYIRSLDARCTEDVTFNWTPVRTKDHSLTIIADSDDVIDESNEENNRMSMNVFVGVPDFIVTNITLNPPDPQLGEIVEVNAIIENHGTDGKTIVEFYVEKEMIVNRIYINETGKNVTINIPGKKMRIYFEDLYVSGDGSYIRIYENNDTLIYNFTDDIKYPSHWTNWTAGGTFVIESNANNSGFVCFKITKYEALLANRSILLNSYEKESINNVYWNTTSSVTGVPNFAIKNHTINVSIDPYDDVVEYNESNNTLLKNVFVYGADLAVTDVNVTTVPLFLGDSVPITATIRNLGRINATDFIVRFYESQWETGDVPPHLNENDDLFSEIMISDLGAGKNESITAYWNLTCDHVGKTYKITAIIDQGNNSDNNIENNKASNSNSGNKTDMVFGKYDFTIEEVSISSQNIREGENVDITATIGNAGNENGNVSVGFYIDMEDNILGGDVAALAYHDCLGAARGWSRDMISNVTGKYIRIGTRDVQVDVDGTNTTSIMWNADIASGHHTVMVVADPDEKLHEINFNSSEDVEGDTDIAHKMYGNNMKNCSLNITPPDVSISSIMLDSTNFDMGDIVNLTAVIKNDENIQANSTLWWVVEGNESVSISRSNGGSGDENVFSMQPQEEALMVRVHFAYVFIRTVGTEGARASIDVVDENDQSLYSNTRTEYDQYEINITDVWTKWGSGDTLKIRTYIRQNSEVSYQIDKYQVLIGNEMITLDAKQSKYCNATWNATFGPGEYTIWTDLEDQNKSSTAFVNETDLAVANISIPDIIWDGDNVSINITITNSGQTDAGNFTVKFSDHYYVENTHCSHSTLTKTYIIPGLAAGASVRIPVQWNVGIRNIECIDRYKDCKIGGSKKCDWTNEHIHDYTITVEIDPLNNSESNKINNHKETEVYVNPSRDFSITNILFTVNNKTCNPSELIAGEIVTLNATVNITNLANCRGSVDVGFYHDRTLLNTTSVVFDAGNGTEYALLDWFMDVGGDHKITVTVDPDHPRDKIVEIDESNNTIDQDIHIESPDFVVTNITFNENNIEVEDNVNITIAFANIGDRAASTNLTVHDYGWRVKEVLSGNTYTINNSPSGSGCTYDDPPTKIERDGAVAMRLYLYVDIDGNDGWVNIYKGQEKEELVSYTKNFRGWTPWVMGDCIRVWSKACNGISTYAEIQKVNYLMQSDTISSTNHSLNADDLGNVTVNWNAPMAGARCIGAKIDPDDLIIEHSESNNEFMTFMSVQGAELSISNIWLMVNDTIVDEIKDGDVVNIIANITNTGIRDAENFSLSFFVDDAQIGSEAVTSLCINESINASVDWNASLGSHWISIGAEDDAGNIAETWMTEELYVCAAELSGSISWQPVNPFDEDEVIINTTITNSGCLPVNNVTVILEYDGDARPDDKYYKSFEQGYWEWINNTWDGAHRVYVHIKEYEHSDGNSFEVYDANCTLIATCTGPCWVEVTGDTANLRINVIHDSEIDIEFYAGDIKRYELSLATGDTTNISMTKKVTPFDHTITLRIDPEDHVPENDNDDNDNASFMHVNATRDFTVTNVTADETNLSDINTTNITASISNIGFRNGRVDVSFVDHKTVSRTYNYYYNKSMSPHYVPIIPDGRIIRSTGADAIRLHVTHWWVGWDLENGPGHIRIYDANRSLVWHQWGGEYGGGFGDGGKKVGSGNDQVFTIPSDTVCIETSHKARFSYDVIIDEFNRTETVLNATDAWNESKNITALWNAIAGNHSITITADPDSRIEEIDEGRGESNNELGILIDVNPSRDPVIVELNYTPLNPLDGSDITITATVRNNGFNTANFTLDFWENTAKKYEAYSEPVVHVPNASWIGWIGTQIGDVWVGSMGDTLIVDDRRANRIGYKRLLNSTHLSLAPNETANVTTILKDLRIRYAPRYSVIAIVDPEDEIDEINENNNRMDIAIEMAYPDFTIAHFNPPTSKDPANVKIENKGFDDASDVTVEIRRDSSDECFGRYCSGSGGHFGKSFQPQLARSAESIRVHFGRLDASDGTIQLRKNHRSEPFADYSGYTEKTYQGGSWDGWSPWVEGDSIWLVYSNVKFNIDRYEWGDVEEVTINHLDARTGDEHINIPEEWEYIEPQNLTVNVDPEDIIPELDEYNNFKTVLMYADLVADGIEFVSPAVDKLSLDAGKFVIDGYITNGGGDKDCIAFPVSDFNVTLEFREPRYPNGSLGKVVFNTTKCVEDPFYAGQIPIRFELDPNEVFEVGGNYSVRLIADSSDDICESNDVYPKEEDKYRLGEFNNITSENVYVYNFSGYTGGGELINIAQGEVNGRVVYTIGDSPNLRLDGNGEIGTIRYADVIPDTVSNIEFARLFVYWTTYHKVSGNYIPELADVDVTFNDYSLNKVGNYSDSGTTDYEYGYGLYSFDVKDHITSGENVATVRNNAEWSMGVSAIGLLVVYEDGDEPLTKYWVNEGADVMMAANSKYPTGLPNDDCITTALFDGVEREDTDNVNATLLTVLGMYSSYNKSYLFSDEGDALEFNDHSIGAQNNTGYWIYHYLKSGIALTNNQWEEVTDQLKRGDNLAKIQSRGNYMMPNNAFLRLIFPPDLAVTDIDAPVSAVIGNNYVINTTISNDGRSDATDFNVSFYSNNMRIGGEPISRLDSGDNITLQFKWKPMHMGKIYKLKVAADVVSGQDWVEPDVDNNEMIKKVPIVPSGFGNESGPIGEGGNGTGGSGDGEGASIFDKITGILMKGTILKDGGGGGGGIGEFSLLEWLMKGLVLTTVALLVYFGYSMEKRRHNKR